MPVDLVWERVNLATEVEDSWRRRRDFKTRITPGGVQYDPGEIAIAEGGIALAWLSFLERRNFLLTLEEHQQLRKVRQMNAYRHCVVIDRIDENSYHVCFLATFDDIKDGSKIDTPISKFFSFAIGDTKPWPPGYEPIKIGQRWSDSFVFCVPVARSNLLIPRFGTANRALLEPGELERITEFMQRRVGLFDKHQSKFRQAQMASRRSSFKLDLSWLDSLDQATPQRRETRAYDVKENTRPSFLPLDSPMFKRRGRRFARPLVPNRRNDIGYSLLENIREHIMNSSPYLQTPKPRFTFARRWHLPRPYYAPTLRAPSATLLKKLFR
ncbi:hypothetical protein HGRIS_012982 [Hohenbuehelia grisea]|uniref:Uncharacterized protein n=1 Tax=Hohenbuehelia grisea TaxID=104357 RepID=A0ABR3IU82_9AGAR